MSYVYNITFHASLRINMLQICIKYEMFFTNKKILRKDPALYCSSVSVRLWEQQMCCFQVVLDPTQTPKQRMHQKRQVLNDISPVYLTQAQIDLRDFTVKQMISWRNFCYSSHGKNNSHSAYVLKSCILLLLNTRFIQLFLFPNIIVAFVL